ncbi:MAG: hypothetical protein LCH95_19230 [Proteobacteria bacterium]|nr:hypothetical protein [Pseudomonadota bacterium]
MSVMTWMLRGLLALGGAALVVVAWPVANAALQQQKADSVLYAMRTGARPVQLDEVEAAIASLDRAVSFDPVAARRLVRSELLAGAALNPNLRVTREQRTQWLREAQGDLETALANDPARGVAWTRLAAVRQALGGPSRAVVAPLMMSLDVAPMLESLWPSRLQLFLDNWQHFTPQERDRVAAEVAMNWRKSGLRLYFAEAIRSPIDELFVRYFIRNEPGAQEELTKWLVHLKKK